MSAGLSAVLRSAGFSLPRAVMQRTPSWHHFILVFELAHRLRRHVCPSALYTFLSEKDIVLMKSVCLVYACLH